jgi:protein-S-isoprenylcysteine O-methyltransferase Ste14
MMGDETVYRVTLGLFLALGLAIRWYFKSKAPTESVDARQSAREARAYALVLGSYLVMFVYVLSPLIDFAHVPLPAGVRWLGAALMLASGGLLYWTHATLGRNWSGVLEIRKEHRVISEGPYARVRHPMYTSFFLSGLGALLLSANWLLGLVNLGVVAWMYFGRVDAEEAMMLEHFGDEYRAYMKKTGRLFPRIGSSA